MQSESTGHTNSKMKASIIDMERSLARKDEDVKYLTKSKKMADENTQRLLGEVEKGRNKVVSLESRIEAILDEKSRWDDEIISSKHQMEKTKMLADQERKERIRHEEQAQALKLIGDTER